MKSINIKGKEYYEVHQRILEFHKLYKNGCIKTKILSNEDGVVLIKATVIPDMSNPERCFYGHASEWQEDTKSLVNATSHIENCETSAVGRALGMLGIGIDTGFASKDEIDIANRKQTMNSGLQCSKCKKKISFPISKYSKERYGKPLCMKCQKDEKPKGAPTEISKKEDVDNAVEQASKEVK